MEITFRSAVPADAAGILEYLKLVGAETDNLTFGAEGIPVTPEQESSFLENMQKHKTGCLILALDGDRIIGDASLSGADRPRLSHRRELGISVLRDYWGRGVASGLMERLIAWARENGVELLTLSVRSDNLRAKALYRKYGFCVRGTCPDELRIGNQSVDLDFMTLSLTRDGMTERKQGPAPELLGKCGFWCGACPTLRSGGCKGCTDGQREGDCFTRDCVMGRKLPYCGACPEFPCEGILSRERSTILDKAWLRWKKQTADDP